MSIRIRRVEGRLIAVCAARTIEKVGDIYLDDNAHHALAEKFSEDFASEGWCTRPIDADDARLRGIEESGNEARTWWDAAYANLVKATPSPAPCLTQEGEHATMPNPNQPDATTIAAKHLMRNNGVIRPAVLMITRLEELQTLAKGQLAVAVAEAMSIGDETDAEIAAVAEALIEIAVSRVDRSSDDVLGEGR